MSVVFTVNKSELPDAVLELELYEDGKPILKTIGKDWAAFFVWKLHHLFRCF